MTNLLIYLPSLLSNKGDAAIAECMLYNIIKTLLYLLWIKLRFIPIDKHGKSILNLYEKSDLIIFGGGGYLGGSYKSIQDVLIPIFLAKRFNKKVYLSAITIEPPRKFFIRKLIQFTLNRVDLITT